MGQNKNNNDKNERLQGRGKRMKVKKVFVNYQLVEKFSETFHLKINKVLKWSISKTERIP